MDMIYFKWNGCVSSLKSEEKDLEVRVVPCPDGLRALVWRLMTLVRGFYKVYHLYRGNKLLCKAEVITWIPFFQFMSHRGIHICSCETVEDERGHGYYPYLLSCIIRLEKNNDVYMMTRTDNEASIRGIKKIGFEEYATGRKSRLGIYKTNK